MQKPVIYLGRTVGSHSAVSLLSDHSRCSRNQTEPVLVLHGIRSHWQPFTDRVKTGSVLARPQGDEGSPGLHGGHHDRQQLRSSQPVTATRRTLTVHFCQRKQQRQQSTRSRARSNLCSSSSLREKTPCSPSRSRFSTRTRKRGFSLPPPQRSGGTMLSRPVHWYEGLRAPSRLPF